MIIGLDWTFRTPWIVASSEALARVARPMRLEPQPALPTSAPGSAAAHAVGAEQASRTRAGLWLGLLGMLIFAGTIPMTRLACGSA